MSFIIPAFIGIVWFFIGAEVEYQVTKHPECPQYRADTNRQQREECRILKQHDEYEKEYGEQIETEQPQ